MRACPRERVIQLLKVPVSASRTYFVEPLTGVALQEQGLGPCRCNLLEHPLQQERRQYGLHRVLTHLRRTLQRPESVTCCVRSACFSEKVGAARQMNQPGLSAARAGRRTISRSDFSLLQACLPLTSVSAARATISTCGRRSTSSAVSHSASVRHLQSGHR
jgi:hypothetical protein